MPAFRSYDVVKFCHKQKNCFCVQCSSKHKVKAIILNTDSEGKLSFPTWKMDTTLPSYFYMELGQRICYIHIYVYTHTHSHACSPHLHALPLKHTYTHTLSFYYSQTHKQLQSLSPPLYLSLLHTYTPRQTLFITYTHTHSYRLLPRSTLTHALFHMHTHI